LYPTASLQADARWARQLLASGHDGFVFFNNDVAGHAVRNALALRRLLGRTAPGARALEGKGR
jgi:uncharacterized protein YecE (DUF72 family)